MRITDVGGHTAAGAGVWMGDIASRFPLESTPLMYELHLHSCLVPRKTWLRDHWLKSRQQENAVSLGFPKFPTLALKASRNHRILLITLLCSAAREGAQNLLHPRKRKQTSDFYSPQVSVGTLAQEGTGCRTQGQSQSGALVYQLLTSPLYFATTPHPAEQTPASQRCQGRLCQLPAVAALFQVCR